MDSTRTTLQEADVRALLAKMNTLQAEVADLRAQQQRQVRTHHALFGRTALGRLRASRAIVRPRRLLTLPLDNYHAAL